MLASKIGGKWEVALMGDGLSQDVGGGGLAETSATHPSRCDVCYLVRS